MPSMRAVPRLRLPELLIVMVGVGLVPLSRGSAQSTPPATVGIDHLILGVDDLERGMVEFAKRTGVTPVKGGVHPGRGTQNALVSLGDRVYVEILAPSREPGTSADARTSFATLTPVGWALHTDDLPAVATQVRAAGFTVSEIRPGARARPDGVRLTWQTAEVSGALLEAAPFFISWGAGTPHPSTQSPTGCTLTSVLLWHPEPVPLQKVLASVKVAVSVEPAAARMRVVLRCPTGSVEF